MNRLFGCFVVGDSMRCAVLFPNKFLDNDLYHDNDVLKLYNVRNAYTMRDFAMLEMCVVFNYFWSCFTCRVHTVRRPNFS